MIRSVKALVFQARFVFQSQGGEGDGDGKGAVGESLSVEGAPHRFVAQTRRIAAEYYVGPQMEMVAVWRGEGGDLDLASFLVRCRHVR